MGIWKLLDLCRILLLTYSYKKSRCDLTLFVATLTNAKHDDVLIYNVVVERCQKQPLCIDP